MLNKNRKSHSYSFNKEDIDKMFSWVLQDDFDFENVDIKDVKYHIRLNPIIENDKLTVIPELISASVDFDADEEE